MMRTVGLESRGRSWTGVVAALVGALLLGAFAAAPSSATDSRRARTADVLVGTVTLRPCHVVRHALCGSLARAWDPTGAVPGTINIGFAFVPARDRTRPALGTVLPREGGPGYSTTDSGSLYKQMYGRLLDRRNMLLVDQRGTGRSAAINCRELQKPPDDLVYGPAAGRCAQSLGEHANLYGTALSADDVAAVVQALGLGKVDLYGDSYGTFFAAVLAGRHGEILRSVVLDAAYPPTGESAWYPTQGQAMLRSIDVACERTPACRSAGATTSTLLAKVVAEVRRSPFRGKAADSDGRMRRVSVDAKALVTVVFGATYGPATYTELPGALRAALHGDRQPLLRLAAESLYGGSNGAPTEYSEGLDAAVTCHDYPQLYDMTAPPAERRSQYTAAVAAETRRNPHLYAPFTITEYQASAWQYADWCLDWPIAPAAHPAGPPAPPSGGYPAVPTLVLSGELDSITTPAEGTLVAGAFPRSRQVVVANSFHVTAVSDTDKCAVRIVRAFVRRPQGGLTARSLSCANEVPPLRAVADYRTTFRAGAGARPTAGSRPRRPALKAAATAVRTGSDLLNRWFNNYSGRGRGLYGGRWSYTGYDTVHFRLHRVRLTRDLAVSGRMTWRRYEHTVDARLHVAEVNRDGHPVHGSAVDGTLVAHWDTRAAGARATIDGRVGGRLVAASMRAP